MRHHILASDYHADPFDKKQHKYIDVIDGLPQMVQLIGDELPIPGDKGVGSPKNAEDGRALNNQDLSSDLIESVPILMRVQDCQINEYYNITIRQVEPG